MSTFIDPELRKKLNDIMTICDGVVDDKHSFCGCDKYDELVKLIKSGKKFVAYNGFEPSGRIHIAQALITVMNANTLINHGGKMIIYIADWFAKLNGKLDGDLDKIKKVGQYFIEVFKACGLNDSNTEFVWASEMMEKSSGTYLQRVINISEQFTLTRIKKCCTIMGKKEGEELNASQMLYPLMQCADIFELNNGNGVDICQLGNDQRKVNMLAREYAAKLKKRPPIILSHKMLMGLKGPKNKMSKSDPDNAIFMEDSKEEIEKKIMKAFCNDEIDDNPIYEYIIFILLRWFKELKLCGINYSEVDDITNAFPKMNKTLLKHDVCSYINQIVEPIRKHFEEPKLKELKELIISYQNNKTKKLTIKSWNVLHGIWEFHYCLNQSPVFDKYKIWNINRPLNLDYGYSINNFLIDTKIKEQMRMQDILKKILLELDEFTILCLQEVSGDLLELLKINLKDKYNLYYCQHFDEPRINNEQVKKMLILYMNTFKLYENNNEYLVTIVPKNIYTKEPVQKSYNITGHNHKSYLLVEIDKLCVINVHLPDYPIDREPFNIIMNELFNKIISQNFIITGDFNSTPIQLENSVKKSGILVHPSKEDTRKGLCNNKLETSCIDHFITSNNIKVSDMKVHDNEDVSDHQMIECTISFIY